MKKYAKMVAKQHGIGSRFTAASLLFVFALEMITPIGMMAITSGPTQPDFTGFEPLGTTGLVNEFTGSFTYNLPLLEVPGPSGSSYPVTLAYHSGAALEEDASWVGFGWSLNPGAINRGTRGIPDDYNGAEIQTLNRQDANETYAIGATTGLQFASYDAKLSYSVANRYNTFNGYSVTSGLALDVFNVVSLQLESTNGVVRYSANINWANAFSAMLTSSVADDAIGSIQQSNVLGSGVLASGLRTAQNSTKALQKSPVLYRMVSSYVNGTDQINPTPTAAMSYTGVNVTMNFGATVGFVPGLILAGVNAALNGSYTWQKPTESINEPSYGYLYNGNATNASGADRMFENEGIYTVRDRYLSPGAFTADDFSVTGQAIGGSMRLIHRRPGFAGPQDRSSHIVNSVLGMEAGLGPDKFTGGARVTVGANFTTVSSGANTSWQSDWRHRPYSPDGNDRAIMRFLNDPADNVRYSPGDSPAHVSSSFETAPAGVFSNINNTLSTDSLYRPRSASCITYRLNRELSHTMRSSNMQPRYFSQSFIPQDVERTYLDRSENSIADGIGEISVTNGNGVRYVYGLPVYSRNERQLTYTRSDVQSMAKMGPGTAYGARVAFASRDGQSIARNVAGTIKPHPYASMFLLTAIQTPDYIDRTMDGPSSDDFGGYTKFNYARAAGTYRKAAENQGNGRHWYKWRTPYEGYSWEEGGRLSTMDDRAAVFMGEREMYYMSEIDTKTHTAIFVTNTTKRNLIVGGKTIQLNGSGRMRNDAFESPNTGNMDIDEEVSGAEPWRRYYLCGFDGDSAQRFRGRVCGGRVYDRELINDSLIKRNSNTNKSQCLERIVLLAKDADGNYTHIVKTVNLEYSYETMQSAPRRYLVNYRWDESLRKNVLIDNVNDWDTVYAISGRLNSRHYHTTRGLLPNHVNARVAVGQYGKLTLKRVWTEYGEVRNSSISPYEFVYSYRDVSTEPYAAELSSESRLATSINFADQYVVPGGSGAQSVNDEIQNPEYDAANVDAWGAYRKDGAEARALRRSHLNQNFAIGRQTRFDPAAWQLKRIILPSGGEIEVHYEQNSYSFVQNRPVEAFVPITSYHEQDDNVIVGLDCSVLPVTPDVIAKYLENHLRQNRLFFKFLFPFEACDFKDQQIEYPVENSEYISGFANASVTQENGNVKVILTGSPLPRALLRELVTNQALVPRKCLGKSLKQTSEGSSSLNVGFIRGLAEAGGNIVATAGDVLGFTNSVACRPYFRHSFVRIPCVSKVGGGVRVKRIFLYDAGVEQGRAGMYGKEYIYERLEDTPAGMRVISSGVATNEPAALREESALRQFIVGRSERSFSEKLAAGEDLEQFTSPLFPSAWPGPSVGYSRVVTRSIAVGPSSPGFTVSDFYTARDYPVRESVSKLATSRIYVPAIPNPLIQVSMTSHYAGQGFSVVTNQMHGKIRAIRQCAGDYSSEPSAWNVVASEEHEYFSPGARIPVLTQTSTGEPNVELKEMGTTEEVMHSVRIVRNDHVSISGNFDVGIQLPFVPVLHAALGPAMQSFQDLGMNVSTKLVSYGCFERRVIYRRDGMIRVQENAAFDEGTGQPIVSMSYDEYDGADVGPSAVHAGAILQMTYPARYAYPQMGSSMVNEDTRHRIHNVGSGSFDVSGSSVGMFVPGDLVALVTTMGAGSSAVPTAFVRVTKCSASKVYFYVLSGNPSAQHKVATIVRSGKTNQLTAAAATVVMHGSPSIISQNPFESTVGRRVLSATATTWNDSILPDNAEYLAVYGDRFSPLYTREYERGLRGKWRPHESFVFRSGTESVVKNVPARNAGRVDVSQYSLFPFKAPSSRDTSKWIRTSRVIGYTPDGDVAAELDAIGIPTTARFSHKGSLPSIIAKNADHASALFESFEDRVGSTSSFAHTGTRSWHLKNSADSVGLLNVTSRLAGDGLVIRAWVRSANIEQSCDIRIGTGPVIGGQRVIADVAGWRLIEWSVPPASGALATTGVKTVFVMSNFQGVFVDDLRLQPASSSSTCYVYDPGTLRLIAQFDDQHFAALFKYTPEGRLSRKDRETEQGVFPIQEQHSNTMAVSYSQRGGMGQADHRTLMMRLPDRVSSESFEEIPHQYPTMYSPGPQGVGAKGEVFDLKYGVDNRRLRLFGDSIALPSIDSMLFKKRPESQTDRQGSSRGGEK